MSTNKAIIFLLLLFMVIVIGTAGYMVLESMEFLDALYMTTITISTVGYREIVDLSATGKIFTIFVIFAGLGIVFYALGNIVSFVIEGEFRDVVRRRKNVSRVENLKDHYIICGAGKTGKYVIDQFDERNVLFVVIDKSLDLTEELLEKRIPHLHGDATQEEILLKANIKKARGVICCLSTDAENVFVVLTARDLNSSLQIVSKAINERSHIKLRKAGADNTVSPNEIGGLRIASLILRPSVIAFLDVIMHAGEETLDMEEVQICSRSNLIGKTLLDARIRERTGLVVVGIKSSNKGKNDIKMNPGPDAVLQEGDKMVVIGMGEQLKKLRNLACEVI